MALTPTIQASEGLTLAATKYITAGIRSSEGLTLAAVNFPTSGERVSQTLVEAALNQKGPMEVSQAIILAAVRGRISNRRVRAWTFTLDGHDFYGLRLGDDATLVFDASSEQWVDWDSEIFPFWRPATVITWPGGVRLAQDMGSSIVAGDDTFGVIWFLDPDQPFDQHPDELNVEQQVPFTRMVMGQIAARGRQVQPCYAAFITGDNYGFDTADYSVGVTLEMSDDAGKTYDDMGIITVTPAEVEQEYSWHSLGQITAPGRLFRISDNGVFARIDSLDLNDD